MSGDQAKPLELAAIPGPPMYLHLQPHGGRTAAVVRSAQAGAASFFWNRTVPAIVWNQTGSTAAEATATPKCLTTLVNGQFSNMAAGACPSKDWRTHLADVNIR